MCNYCGCRAIQPIAQLTSEHEQILQLSHEIRLALARDDRAVAARILLRLHGVLEVHDAVEELALYPAMARQQEFADKVGELFDEHDELDQVILAALRDPTPGSPTEDRWSRVLAGLALLAEHIDHEEHGLFPAAAVCLDPSDWERATSVRLQREAGPGASDPGGRHAATGADRAGVRPARS
jgi:hemerythrin-like domain-containing protein